MKQENNNDSLQKKEAGIDAFDFFIVILKYKKLILAMVIGAGLLSALYVLLPKTTAPPVLMYRSECALLINTRDSNVETIAAKVKYEQILKEVLEKCQHMEKDLVNMTYEAFAKMIKFNADPASQTLNIVVESKDPQLSQKTLLCFVSQFRDVLRDDTLEPLKANRSNLLKIFHSSENTHLKRALADRIVFHEEQIFSIKNAKYYESGIMKSSSGSQVQSQDAKPVKSVNPIVFVALTMFLALLVSVTIAFILEYFQNLMKAEPQKLRAMKKSLRFRGRDQ